MEKFDVHILGCGSALPTLRHSATSQVVNIREKLFMIDCGEGTQVQLRRSRLRFGRLNHIFISHLHGDHCFGLMGLISTFGMLERTADLHIYAHAELEKLLAPQLNYFCKGMTYKVVFHAIDPGDHSWKGFRLLTVTQFYQVFQMIPQLSLILPLFTSSTCASTFPSLKYIFTLSPASIFFTELTGFPCILST